MSSSGSYRIGVEPSLTPFPRLFDPTVRVIGELTPENPSIDSALFVDPSSASAPLSPPF